MRRSNAYNNAIYDNKPKPVGCTINCGCWFWVVLIIIFVLVVFGGHSIVIK